MNNEKMIDSIRNLCKTNNITPTKLEEELGFSQGLISRWRDKTPSIDKIIDIANYFHTSLDEVVGYKKNIDDDFLNLLYEKTSDGSIKWSIGTELLNQGCQIKLWDKSIDEQVLMAEDHVQTIYATKFQKGYIIVYSCHHFEMVAQPEELILFIQPSDESYLVDQHYILDELKPIWTKILNSLGEKAPDSIRAEDLKNSFINEFSSNKPKKKKIIFVKNPHNTTQTDLLSPNSTIRPVFDKTGCVLFDIETKTILEQNPQTGVTSTAKSFYYENKELLGNIKEAKLEKGEILFLISDTKIMKLSGFSWGKECGMTGYNGLITVLTDAGFDTSDHTVFDKENLVLYPIKQ